MKKKDFYIGLNGLILVFYCILWFEQPFGFEMFVPFVSQRLPIILWAILNIFYWYRSQE